MIFIITISTLSIIGMTSILVSIFFEENNKVTFVKQKYKPKTRKVPIYLQPDETTGIVLDDDSLT